MEELLRIHAPGTLDIKTPNNKINTEQVYEAIGGSSYIVYKVVSELLGVDHFARNNIMCSIMLIL